MKKEEKQKLEIEVESMLNSKIEEINPEIKKEKIIIVLNKSFYMNIIDFHLNITIPDANSQDNYEFLLEINLIYNTIHLFSKLFQTVETYTQI